VFKHLYAQYTNRQEQYCGLAIQTTLVFPDKCNYMPWLPNQLLGDSGRPRMTLIARLAMSLCQGYKGGYLHLYQPQRTNSASCQSSWCRPCSVFTGHTFWASSKLWMSIGTLRCIVLTAWKHIAYGRNVDVLIAYSVRQLCILLFVNIYCYIAGLIPKRYSHTVFERMCCLWIQLYYIVSP
jgi:hypothetical protein